MNGCPHWVEGACQKGCAAKQQGLPGVDKRKQPSKEAWALAEGVRKVLQVPDTDWAKKRWGWAVSADRALAAGWDASRLLRLAQWGLELGYGLGSIPQLVDKAQRIKRHVEDLDRRERARRAGYEAEELM